MCCIVRFINLTMHPPNLRICNICATQSIRPRTDMILARGENLFVLCRMNCSFPELIKIVDEYVTEHFVEKGLCAVAAIHEGRNKDDPDKNNPHVHIIVSTRTVGPDGFNKKKDREHNKTDYTRIWRSSWSGVQNRAYERNGLDIRVSHESLEVQGIRRKPLPYLNRIDYQKEERGIRTSAGDRRRAVQEYNRMLVQKRQLKRTRGLEIELSR